MNKKGFTLVELMVSITLLSIVLIFMMNTLVKLRDTNIAEGVETNLIVMQALIGKEINTDILKNGGIKSIELNGEATEAIITLDTNNRKYRKINIISYEDNSDKTTLKYEVCSNDVLNNAIPCNAVDTLVNKTIEGDYRFDSLYDNGNNYNQYANNIIALSIYVRLPNDCIENDTDACWIEWNKNNYDIHVLSYFE